jgi:hypothetical protein
MRTFKKAAVATVLALGMVATPVLAHAGHWRGYRPYYGGYHHHGFFLAPPLIGLSIAGAVLGTAAVVDSIVRPRVVYYPPPPPPYYDYGYRRGYDDGRRDAYDDDYRYRR